MKKITILLCVLSLLGVAYYALARTTVVVVRQSAAATTNPITVVTAAQSTATTGNCVVTISPTAGNLLVGAFATFQNTTPGSDTVAKNGSAPASFTLIDSQVNTNISLSLHYLGAAGESGTTVTFTPGETPVVSTCVVYEVSGVSATPFTTGEKAKNSLSTTTNPVSADITNATANSIIFAAMTNVDGANPSTLTINGTGTDGTWSIHANASYTDGSSRQTISVPYRIVTSGGTYNHGWTTSNYYAATIAAVFHE